MNKSVKRRKIMKIKKKVIKNRSRSMTFIEKYLSEGEPYLDTLNEQELSSMIRKANTLYYCNNEPIMTDSQYDMLKEYIEEKFPNNVAISEGHTKCSVVVEKSKVKLPFQMWSMDKIKDKKGIQRKLKKYKGPYVVSAKMDGISALYQSKDGVYKLYTRGNGITGQDISWMIDYINVPRYDEDFTVRGELIIKKKVFKKKYSKNFANTRNFVAGVANSKNVETNMVKDIDFVAYEVIEPLLKPSKQIKYLLDNKYNTVPVVKGKNNTVKKVDNEILSELLMDWRENLEHEIDGIIVTHDKIYPRKSGNPDHAFAFKMVLSDQIVESMVLDVEWHPSKDGYLKPKLKIKPVKIGGAKIQYVTAHNAAYIVNNKIGIGTIIQIIRSGDVIPKVHSVVAPSDKPKMPTDYDYEWNKTKIDLVLLDADSNEVVRIKQMDDFFKTLDVSGLGRGNIKRLYDAGYTDIYAILGMTLDDYVKIEGFKEKSGGKILNSIKDRLENCDLSDLMSASNMFGRGLGVKKMKLIMDNYPNILTMKGSDKKKLDIIGSLEGFNVKTAGLFVPNISKFITFMKDIGYEHRLDNKNNTKKEKHALSDKKIVMTGAKDKTLKKKFDELGIKLSSSVSKNTDFVIVSSMDETTSKMEKAKKLGITIVLAKDFIKKYL